MTSISENAHCVEGGSCADCGAENASLSDWGTDDPEVNTHTWLCEECSYQRILRSIYREVDRERLRRITASQIDLDKLEGVAE